MASRVVMPKLTDTMEEGHLIKWYKQEGDRVESGDLLAEIETDKAVMDLEAYASGILRKIIVPADRTVPAGTLIAVVAGPEEDISSLLAETAGAASPIAAPIPSAREAAPSATAGPPPSAAKLIAEASPVVRKMAEEHGIDLTKIRGTGPGGKIIKRDIEVYLEGRLKAQPAEAVSADYTEKELSMLRKTIARTMVQSKAPAPHFYVTVEVDMGSALAVKKKLEQKKGQIKITVTDLLIKAAALALLQHPDVNVSYSAAGGSERLRSYKAIHIGMAVGLEEGVIAPVIRDCQRKNLFQIAQEAKALIQRAKDRKLLPEEYTGSTFSISNLGMFEVESFSAILTPPQAGAIAVGAVREVPVIVTGRVMTGHRMKVTMSCDHRAIDGLQAAKFLADFKRILESPNELMSEKL
jgi:pyruvate dehydrogenase E2 component (dihydrolipoyllysine-residue acetyltransferase)